MRYHNTVLSVLTLLSAHSDVVHAAPSEWSDFNARGNLGGSHQARENIEGSLQAREDFAERDAPIVSFGDNKVEARDEAGHAFDTRDVLEARVDQAWLDKANGVLDIILKCGAVVAGIAGAAIASGQITVTVTEGGALRRLLDRCFGGARVEHGRARLANGVDLVEQGRNAATGA